MVAELPYSAAADRNTLPILSVLETLIEPGTRVLEIGSGTGQHCCRFAPALSVDRWQPTELADGIEGLSLRLQHEGDDRVSSPLVLDVARDEWPAGPYDHVYTANTFHIMSWEQVLACLAGVSGVLATGGSLSVYGPFRDGDEHNSPSNAAFDQSLRVRNPAMGVRDLRQVVTAAADQGLQLEREVALPANNRMVIFRRLL